MSKNKDVELMETPSSQFNEEQISQVRSFSKFNSKLNKNKNKIIIVLGVLSIFLSICLIAVIMKPQSNTTQCPIDINSYNQFDYMVFDYPTVGIPIPGNTYNSTRVSSKDLNAFDQQINRMLKPYNDTNCDFVRIGNQPNQNDGGYLICKNAVNNIEAVVNLGINGEDQFGCDLTTLKKVPNHQFDCTNPVQPVCNYNDKNNHFNFVCAASHSKIHNGKNFISLQRILSDRNLTKKHIFLKTDTEGAEWDTFKHFPEQKLEYIDQIALQLHLGNLYPEQWGQLDILRTLMKYFVNINYHMNNHGCTENRKLPSIAIEATLVNKKLLTFNSQTQSYALHPLNKINNPEVPDCQMNQN